jgi:starch synthase
LYARETLYTDDPDEAIRFALLSRAVLESCQREEWAPNVIHCNDWQTALIPAYLKSTYAWDKLFANTRTVFTIHNLGYTGAFSSTLADALGIPDPEHYFNRDDLHSGYLSFLKTGIEHADRLTTVSPTYAQEIQTEEHGFGMHAQLQRRSDVLSGILNGVDDKVWNPRTDTHIAVNYGPGSLELKEQVKQALLEDLSLPYEEGVPVIGIITRLAGQKGVNLLVEPLPTILDERDLRLVVLGSGEPAIEQFFEKLQARFPDKVCFYRGFHAQLAHMIEAGSDFFLMPSLYEPCGLNQMYSLAYATVPIVRKTGGLADTVFPFDAATGEGNGIVFEDATTAAANWAINTALDVYADESAWPRLRSNGIENADFSWDRAAARYIELYMELCGDVNSTEKRKPKGKGKGKKKGKS